MKLRSLSQLQLAVFDLDGTLVEIEHEHFAERIGFTLKKIGLEPPPIDQILQVVHQHTLPKLLLELDGPKLEKIFWDLFDEGDIPPLRLFDQTLYTLEEVVSRGMQVAIATARQSHHDEMRARLAATGILKHVQFISTFYQTGWKNKIEQLKLVCAQHRIEPDLAMMVGDSADDMRSSAMAGFALRLAMKNGVTEESLLQAQAPDRMIECIGEVPSAVDEYHS